MVRCRNRCHKNLDLSSLEEAPAEKKSGANEEAGGGSGRYDEKEQFNIQNFIINDLKYIKEFAASFHDTWVCAISLVVYSSMLYNIAGSTLRYCGAFMCVGFVFNYLVVSKMNSYFDKIFSQRDKRMSLLSDIIEGMKSIKYLSWENVFWRRVAQIRSKEFQCIMRFRMLDGVLQIFWNSLTYILLFVFLYFYLREGHAITNVNIYKVILIFWQLVFPIGILPWVIKECIQWKIIYRRINIFMAQQEITQTHHLNADAGAADGDLRNAQRRPNAVEISQTNFQIPLFNQTASQPGARKPAKQRFLLKVDQLKIRPGELTFVVGKVGSGKSSLLNSLISEMEVCQPGAGGTTGISVLGTTGIVTQNHWI